MLKAGDLAHWEDRQVKGVKIGKVRRDLGISHVCVSVEKERLKETRVPIKPMLI